MVFRKIAHDDLTDNAFHRLGQAVLQGVTIPALSDGHAADSLLRGQVLGQMPANLLQAQRDYFGAHTYERVDKPRGEFFHTNWTGRGGTTASSTYTV